MFSKVIIATDFSAASTEVVRGAHGFLPVDTKEILLLKCIKSSEAESIAYLDTPVDVMLQEQENILIKQRFNTKSEIVFGSPHTEINRIAKERDYSLIVVGSHGQTLAQDILLGSVASEMIQASLIPILVVRLQIVLESETKKETVRLMNSYEYEDFYSSILFPTDFSENADEALLYVEKLVEKGTKSVTLFHVQDMVKLEKNTKEEFEKFDEMDMIKMNAMKERLLKNNKNSDIKIKIVYGKPSIEIVKYSWSTAPSLIVMGSQGKGYIKELFIGSVSHAVTRLANTSVLLIPMSSDHK